ncbi:DUF4942 domain-containing protein [Paenilisteria rocourtiae]|uniref:Methyltransferase family protein n=1 Tax=Listeria rocourtiae TaxID=647910 RepID=A0A4R6ZR12_9LIST|nr:DUF4942 domain-containing protein [Listeria rocourtiae]EUJ44425.1 DNA-methyltransferase [Listeria rocourtiae FSL F6-920]TDR55093.1 methyltransferase family protein [Listeria rocourtiae]
MFNDTFYPSPSKVINLLLSKLRTDGLRILEPSAGKGDIIDAINRESRSARIDAIEKELELCAILTDKNIPVIAYDFLSFETNTEYDAIIMNPPFDEGDKHLLKAIELAEAQATRSCKIRAIINAETIRNPHTKTRQHLAAQLQKYSATVVYHENLFATAERKTDVECAIINLEVNTAQTNVSSTYATIIEGVERQQTANIETSLSTILSSQEVAERVQDIETLVHQYDFHVQLIKEKHKASTSLEYLESLIYAERNENMGTYNKLSKDINEDIEAIRVKYWGLILRTGEFSKRLTEHGRRQIDKYIANASALEINFVNIELLLMAIMQNSNDIILDSCLDMFDKVTKYHNNSYSGNVHYYNGWDTNDAFRINKKIIVPFYPLLGAFDASDMGHSRDGIFYKGIDYKVKDYLDDLVKMFKLISPDFDETFQTNSSGEFENELLRFKMFNKGTIHIWFKDEALLDKFNVICGQHRNWIPSDDEIKRNKDARSFVDKEFKTYAKQLKIGA